MHICKVVTHEYYVVRMHRYLLILDAMHVIRLVYSNVCTKNTIESQYTVVYRFQNYALFKFAVKYK